MHPTVAKALAIIETESRAGHYTDAHDAARAIVIEWGEQDLADRLFVDIPGSVPFRRVSHLFDFLAWQTDDNGAAMTRTVERWLVEGRDIRKVQIALNLEVYPFPDAQEMYRVLTQTAKTFPQLAERCEQLIGDRQTLEARRN